MLLRKASAVVLASLLAFSFATRADADAVRSPPSDCPEGQVGVTSHAGPRCELVAPKDCPAGWRGQLGGVCALHPCEDDSGCEKDEACIVHSVCLQPFEDEYYDYGEEDRERHGALEPTEGRMLASPNLLAGPQMPKTRRAKPIIRYNAVNLCTRDGAPSCDQPRTCQHEKLCAPKGGRAVAFLGKNVRAARVARKTETPLTVSKIDPVEPPAATTSTTPATVVAPGAPEKRGCAGCSVAASSEAPYAAIGAIALVAGAGARRRRRA